MSIPENREIYFSLFKTPEENTIVLNEMLELFKQNSLYPNIRLEQRVFDQDEFNKILEWKHKLKEYLVYYNEGVLQLNISKKNKVEEKQESLLYTIIKRSEMRFPKNYLTTEQIKMIIEGSQEVFINFYSNIYKNSLYKDSIDWFKPEQFIFSVVIGYIYKLNTIPANFSSKCIDRILITDENEEKLVTERYDREEIKKSFYPFDVNDYQNKTIQRTGLIDSQRQTMPLGSLFSVSNNTILLKNLIVTLYGSDLWITGLMNMISGFGSSFWKDQIGDLYSVINILGTKSGQKEAEKIKTQRGYSDTMERNEIDRFNRALINSVNQHRKRLGKDRLDISKPFLTNRYK